MNTEKRHRSVDMMLWTIILGVVIMAVNQCVHEAHGSDNPWRSEWSSGVSLGTKPGIQFYVNIPQSGHLNMVSRNAWWKTAPHAITMQFKVNAKAGTTYRAEDGGTPCTMRFYLQRKGDDMSGQGDKEFYRWWSNPVCYVFGSRDNKLNVLTAKIIPAQWSDVWGHQGNSNPAMFKKAWNDASKIGVTFGGRFFGHGIGDSGAILVVKKITVQ